MSRSVRMFLIGLFVCLGIAGLWHGFPLMDVFADEMYYAYGPLYSLQHFWPFPHNVPYGTVTFYLTLPLQVVVLSIAWLYGVARGLQIADVIMRYPFLVYIAPRVLSVSAFLIMLQAAFRYVRTAAPALPYAAELITIGFANLVLITFMHSGKMWMISLLFLFLCGLHVVRSPVRSMVYAGLAFANFPIMGIFWLLALIMNLTAHRTSRSLVWRIALIGCLLPVAVMLLNMENIVGQVREIFGAYIYSQVQKAAPAGGSTSTILSLYVATLWAYLIKLCFTGLPALLVAAVALVSRARVRDGRLFLFSAIGVAAYVLAVSCMFYSAYLPGYLRYLLPLYVLTILLLLSLEFGRTPFVTVCLRLLSGVSVYCAVMVVLSLSLPTTYNTAQRTLYERYSSPRFLILSRVSQIALPFNRVSAQLTQTYTPDTCSYRCQYALQGVDSAAFRGAYVFVPSDDVEQRLRALATASGYTIVDMALDSTDAAAVQVEQGMGSYFVRQAWIPAPLGQKIVIQERRL